MAVHCISFSHLLPLKCNIFRIVHLTYMLISSEDGRVCCFSSIYFMSAQIVTQYNHALTRYIASADANMITSTCHIYLTRFLLLSAPVRRAIMKPERRWFIGHSLSKCQNGRSCRKADCRDIGVSSSYQRWMRSSYPKLSFKDPSKIFTDKRFDSNRDHYRNRFFNRSVNLSTSSFPCKMMLPSSFRGKILIVLVSGSYSMTNSIPSIISPAFFCCPLPSGVL